MRLIATPEVPVVDPMLDGAVSAALREHLADQGAALTDLVATPIPGNGCSGNRLWRTRVCWTERDGRPGAANWVVKRWQAGGQGAALLGVTRPLEALAWQQGLLKPAALPAGVVAPIVGATCAPDGASAWTVMEDVGAALAEYSRERPLPPAAALTRVKQALDGLARLHAWWERPARRARPRGCDWLVSAAQFARVGEADYAAALDGAAGRPSAVKAAVAEELRADLWAFLEWLPARQRPLWQALLRDRAPLVAALRAVPRTLLHGDADDRNIGLRRAADPVSFSGTQAAHELVLIDWEWIGWGPPALDFGRLWGTFAAVCALDAPPAAALSSGELPDWYYERYAAAGGTLTDRVTWQRTYPLGVLAAALTQAAFFGRMVRERVQPVLAKIERQMELLQAVEQYLP